MSVRVRYAPSPTGWIHIGNMRTILFDYFMQQKYGGEFILRIEDTDQKRAIKNGVEGIVETLKLFGVMPNEGYGVGGDYGPYIQSERLDLYQKYAKDLVESGHAYHCFCTKERLEELRAEQVKMGQKTQYDRHCRNLSKEEVAEKLAKGEPNVIRLKVDDNQVLAYDDLVYGHIEFNTNDVEDQVLLKSDGFPTYHLGVVVDDYLMKITHVLRGEDWHSSTPKQILLYKAFGWDAPIFCHVPNVMNPGKKGKLSKRKGDVAVVDFLRKGFTVEGLINYLSMVGWNPDPKVAHQDEFYDLKFLIENFDPERIKRSSGAFDIQKLEAINAMWNNHFSIPELMERFEHWIDMVNASYVIDEVRGVSDSLQDLRDKTKLLMVYIEQLGGKKTTLFEILQPRIKTFSDIWAWLSCLFDNYYMVDEEFKAFAEKVNFNLQIAEELIGVILKLPNWQQDMWEPAVRAFADEKSWKHADMFMLLRYIVTGKRVSLPLRDFMDIIGPEAVQKCFENFKKQV